MPKDLQNNSLAQPTLLLELSKLIEQSKQQVAVAVNSSLTLLFWQIGKRINDEILQNQRADYGKQIVATLANDLEAKYGRNFNEKNVRRMLQFAEQFADFEIVVPLARQFEIIETRINRRLTYPPEKRMRSEVEGNRDNRALRLRSVYGCESEVQFKPPIPTRKACRSKRSRRRQLPEARNKAMTERSRRQSPSYCKLGR